MATNSAFGAVVFAILFTLQGACDEIELVSVGEAKPVERYVGIFHAFDGKVVEFDVQTCSDEKGLEAEGWTTTPEKMKELVEKRIRGTTRECPADWRRLARGVEKWSIVISFNEKGTSESVHVFDVYSVLQSDDEKGRGRDLFAQVGQGARPTKFCRERGDDILYFFALDPPERVGEVVSIRDGSLSFRERGKAEVETFDLSALNDLVLGECRRQVR